VSGRFRTEAQPGQVVPLTLEFANVGFAAPFNPRGIELVLRCTSTGKKFFAELSRDTDARWWRPGLPHVLHAELSLPADMPAGDYELLLNLPDPAPTLYGMVPYSLRLANAVARSGVGVDLGEVWEANTGYHHLRQTLSVNTTATNAPPGGTEIPVLTFSAIAEVYNQWERRNFQANPGAGFPGGNPVAADRVNLVAYAVGSDANVPDDGGYLHPAIVAGGLALAAPKGPGAANDVDVAVEGTPGFSSGDGSEDGVTILENRRAMIRAHYRGGGSQGYLPPRIATPPGRVE
jgi:hypothetical protein